MSGIKERIIEKLRERKVRENHKGFIYLSKAIEIFYKHEYRFDIKMGDVYTEIARETNDIATKVNDAIRYVISYIDGYEQETISNRELIEEVVSEIEIEDIFLKQERIRLGIDKWLNILKHQRELS